MTEAEAYTAHSGTEAAYGRLLSGGAELLLAYRPSRETLDRINRDGVKLKMKPVDREGRILPLGYANIYTIICLHLNERYIMATPHKGKEAGMTGRKSIK